MNKSMQPTWPRNPVSASPTLDLQAVQCPASSPCFYVGVRDLNIGKNDALSNEPSPQPQILPFLVERDCFQKSLQPCVFSDIEHCVGVRAFGNPRFIGRCSRGLSASQKSLFSQFSQEQFPSSVTFHSTLAVHSDCLWWHSLFLTTLQISMSIFHFS